jgi:hypothetical protein
MASQLAVADYYSHITPDKDACQVKFNRENIFFLIERYWDENCY